MTNAEQMAIAYPDHIDRIRLLCTAEFLKSEPPCGRAAPNTLASGFDWAKTPEEWQFWSDLYDRPARKVELA